MANQDPANSNGSNKYYSKRLFGKKPQSRANEALVYNMSDDLRSECSTLVDFSDDGVKGRQLPRQDNGRVVAQMLDPEDMAWGSPSSSRSWSLFSQKKQSRRRQGSKTSTKSSTSSQGWAQDFDPEDQAWTRK